MKGKLLFLFIFLNAFIFSMYAKEPLSYQKVIEFEGYSKNDLYDSTRQAIAKIFTNAKFATQYENSENGTIILNCHDKIKFNFLVAPTDFKMTINIKDGKMRITFSDILMTASVGKATSTAYVTNEKALNDFMKEGNKIIDNLVQEIKNKSASDDW